MDKNTGRFVNKAIRVRRLHDITGGGEGDIWRGDQNEGTGQARPSGMGVGGVSQPAPVRFNMGLPGAGKPESK